MFFIFSSSKYKNRRIITCLFLYIYQHPLNWLFQCFLSSPSFILHFQNVPNHFHLNLARDDLFYLEHLLIDDIQFLAGKQSTQDEFFNIFSVLQNMRKQIVITSDRPPAEIKGLHSRLLSRFDTGLIADLQPPNLETRLAILQKKSEADKECFITDEVLCYVANNVTSNIRELEGTLIKLSAYVSFTRTPISVDIAKQILGDTVRNSNQPVNIRRVIESVAVEFDTTLSLLTSQTRKKNVAIPRQIAMYLARQLTDNSLHTIGLAFGRDYSTVIHSLKKVESEILKNPDLKNKVERLQQSLS